MMTATKNTTTKLRRRMKYESVKAVVKRWQRRMRKLSRRRKP
jgi:hypothetical protein